MARIDERYARLLAAPDPVAAELARQILADAGIPSLLHGADRDYAELGASMHALVARSDLYVPHAALEQARELLREAWGDEVARERFGDAEPA